VSTNAHMPVLAASIGDADSATCDPVGTAIRCRALCKSFGPQVVLRDLDLDIPEGAITVILGPSGTGKSVLLKHVMGLMRPDAGDVEVEGRSLAGMRPSTLLVLRRGIGTLFQDGALFSSMDVFDNIAFPLRQHTNLSEREISEIVRDRLADVGLGDAGTKMPSQLSGGMRKRAGLARALVLDPRIVLFDEPDSGLDPVRTALLCELIAETHQAHGGTYVIITHDISSARRIGEFIALLWRGSIVESGSASQMFGSRHPFVAQFLTGDSVGPLGME
jgi:phospholipid/cholesterol/gamma-HCH transport system ATP-binding protein